ncbi:TlpA family protein disulfide reductase [Frigoriglobus tundricola]|uniref:Redoxin domain protein n=1 Tax=Frigoriglobus tundricola TaxID=2774151 RepID=A0A6M5YFT0_9BACT|nr:TlpA disulfide reductase family protein [Frigoriglobus tundricola]QJW92889.1 Redoxin domain protein [Frigoriglobus tundricola]
MILDHVLVTESPKMRRFVFVFFGFLLALTGCALPEPASGELPEVRADELEKALDDQKGKVVLVDFWATWCPPCRERFPHFVKTHEKYAGKGLTCMSVSLDNDGPGDGRADKQKVINFLKKHGAKFPNYLLANYQKDAVKVGRRFGLEGSIPFVALFDKTGKKVWDREQKELTDEELDKLIESELAK